MVSKQQVSKQQEVIIENKHLITEILNVKSNINRLVEKTQVSTSYKSVSDFNITFALMGKTTTTTNHEEIEELKNNTDRLY